MKFIVPTLVVGTFVLTAGVYGVGITLAQDEEAGHTSLIQKLAARFNVEESEVEGVFAEHHQEMQAERVAEMEEKLSEAVEDGKITAEQRDALVEKKGEMKSKHEGLKDLSPEDRRAQMKEFRGEMKDWAEENDIDMRDIAPKDGKGKRGGKGMGGSGGPHGGPRF